MSLQIIEVDISESEHNLDAWMLHSIIFLREYQFEIRDLRLDAIAMQWKNHRMWNPTIPQDEKFSTVHVEANHRD